MGVGRETDLRRRPNQREQRQTVLIVTNGHVTEKKYFEALKLLPWVRPGRVAVVFTNGSPEAVVRDADRRRSQSDFDSAWAICDVDDFPTASAVTEGERLEVRIAWSNPCFEVWLILHKADCMSYMENAKKVRTRIEALVRNFDKSTLDFAQFRNGIAAAVARAKALQPAPEGNPSTSVWQLVEALGFEEDANDG